MSDSKIVGVGGAGDIRIPKDATVFDAKGKTVMPGLIDCHTHLGALSTEAGEPPSMWALGAAKDALATLEAGFTTVRHLGGLGIADDIGLKTAVAKGVMRGPRIFCAGVMWMTTTGPGLYRPYAFPATDGVDEIRKRVREYICLGADVIKMFCSGGIGKTDDRISRGGYAVRNYTPEELSAGVDEAHALGKKAAGHAIGNHPIENAIEAGFDSIEHGTFMDAKQAKKMVDKGIYWVPTVGVLTRYSSASPTDEGVDLIEDARSCLEGAKESFGFALKAGVKIATGTDIPFRIAHGENAYEVSLMVEHGLSEMQAIVASTKNAADLIGAGSVLGTLEKGKLADVLVIDGDPLENIATLQDKNKIKLVVKDGRVEVNRGAKSTKGS